MLYYIAYVISDYVILHYIIYIKSILHGHILVASE